MSPSALSQAVELLIRIVLLAVIAQFITDALEAIAEVSIPWPYPAVIATLVWLAMLRGYLARRRSLPNQP